ncbi:MAG TPA: TIGR03088 family PEP-CTERM/XrtA system glycosyltransferase [Casimicrobiaceae bacterium]|nr:TIGR03088 family PEP-CTERM/XrtA system glycosyltransferase [Casimicrobiaceae bacterium]
MSAGGATGVDSRPLVAHVVYRFDVGGLENGVVNLLNRMPSERYRHAVVSLTEVTPFRHRVLRDDVEFVELHKAPGHGVRLFPKLFGQFRRLRPAIVHTRNLAALEATIPATFAGVPVRVHGEHGRDVGDLDGSNRTYRMVRRMHRPFVTQYVALSQDLERYLVDAIGVPRRRIERIINGVDTQAFAPVTSRRMPTGCPFSEPGAFVFGTVGRLQAVKNQALLARAFVRLLEIAPDLRERVRLVIVGEGSTRAEITRILADAGAAALAWLPGARDDVAQALRSFDAFVLPSLAEGISNTILEAMASGLPVIATRVGGNAELVEDGTTGTLVASADSEALAMAMLRYARDPGLARSHGQAGRARAEHHFSLDAMVAQYTALYDRLLDSRRGRLSRVIRTDASQRAARATSGGH